MFIDQDISPGSFDWAGGIPEIKKAFQYFKYQAEHKIDTILSPGLISSLKSLAANMNLLNPDLGNMNLEHFLQMIVPPERPMAEFCFLTMFEPHRVYEKHFQAINQTLKDEEILQTAAFVSMLMAESIGKELYKSVGK